MLIFDIKRYAINDGPGIRTTIFMKGCPLRCVWCHNPESWLPEPEVLFKQSKCIGCNTCGLYPDRLPPKRESTPNPSPKGRGTALDETIAAKELSTLNSKLSTDSKLSTLNYQLLTLNCPAKALEMCGREWTMDELMAEVEKERDVMEDSGGGVTLCGGEPLMQPQAALAVLKELGRRGLHRTVDTSLYASQETVKAIAEETDLFLVDLKHMDSNRHRELTGVPNEPILENARLLMELGANIWFRLPLIEGINDDEENIEATASFIASLNAKPSTLNSKLSSLNSKLSTLNSTIHLLPYHDVGKDKHRRRGTEYNPEGLSMKAPSDETLDRCRQQFERHGISVVVGG